MQKVINLDVFGFWVDKEKEAHEDSNRYPKSETDNPEATAQQPHLDGLGEGRRRSEWWWNWAEEKNPRKWFKSFRGKRETLEGCDVFEKDYEWKRQRTETPHHPLCFHFNAIQYKGPAFAYVITLNAKKITPSFFVLQNLMCHPFQVVTLLFLLFQTIFISNYYSWRQICFNPVIF